MLRGNQVRPSEASLPGLGHATSLVPDMSEFQSIHDRSRLATLDSLHACIQSLSESTSRSINDVIDYGSIIRSVKRESTVPGGSSNAAIAAIHDESTGPSSSTRPGTTGVDGSK